MGSFLDPMADKVLIATLFLSLTYVDLIPGEHLSDKCSLIYVACRYS
jgi:phosphatidylglycerophosphate synthase